MKDNTAKYTVQPVCEPDKHGPVEPFASRIIKRIGVIVGQEHFPSPKKRRKGEEFEDINGPCLVRVPAWVERPLGKYYLYFANHRDKYIRLAYADAVEGPYTFYKPGILHVNELHAKTVLGHIASPDVIVDDGAKEIRAYFHSGTTPSRRWGDRDQLSGLAVSKDGVHFTVKSEQVAPAYLRVFKYRDEFFGIAKGSNSSAGLFRSPDGVQPFEPGPEFLPQSRHYGILLEGQTLHVAYSRPERILYVALDTSAPDWRSWKLVDEKEHVVLVPEEAWEGADLPFREPTKGAAFYRLRQLRDPALYREGDEWYLLYSVAGEYGIAIAKLVKEGEARINTS
jgi:hypothetical protein